MYFGKEKENTNIDKEFNKNNKINFDFKNLKLPLIIFGIIALLIIVIIIITSINKNNNTKYFINLLGNENITIYQGDTYNEPGYNAFDSRHNKLNDQVIVDNQVNSDIIGKFQVTYTLKDVIKVRYVNVVEKPIGATSIYLKGVNGSINVYLKVGEKYIEPGFKAIDTVDSGLTDKVKVTGEVNTKKEGVYQLVYSVVNSSGITTSATRTVIVVSSNLNLNLSTKNYTNKNIKIYINVLDNYFDYLILPNNKKITEQNYEYEVSENGTYKFVSYNKHGDKVEKSIKISNIDKESPSGSCSGYYKDGKSYITVKASDNIGISKYVIDSNTYTSSGITINKELNKADITIYDKSNNTKIISCDLKDENSKLDKIYTSSNSHTSSITGIKYKIYYQNDPEWASLVYSNGQTIEQNGCMITSMASVASAYDHTITPITTFNNVRHVYPYSGIETIAGNGFDCYFSSDLSSSYILGQLKKGNVVVIQVKGKSQNYSSVFTSSQHYMALIDYKNDQIFIANGYGDSGYAKHGWYDKNIVLTSVREAHVCAPTQELKNKFK